jgi:hypothetical protein
VNKPPHVIGSEESPCKESRGGIVPIMADFVLVGKAETLIVDRTGGVLVDIVIDVPILRAFL